MAGGVQVQPERSNNGGAIFDWPPMTVTAGVRFPVYCGNLILNGNWQAIPHYVPGSEVYVVLNSTGGMVPDFTGKPWHVSGTMGAEVNGGNIRSIPASGSDSDNLGVHVFCVYPKSSGNFGLQISDSSNLLEITDVSQGLRPIYKYEGNITGSWGFPSLPGYDTSKMIAFVHWNNPNVSFTLNTYVENSPVFYTEGIACVQPDRNGRTDGLQRAATGWARVVIFYPGGPVHPSTGCGIEIFNGAGQLTWSSATTPFIIRGTVGHSFNWEGVRVDAGHSINQPMIPMTMPGFYWKADDYMATYGMKSNGREFTLTRVTNAYTGRGPGPINSVSNMRLPVLDATDYF